MALLFVVVRLPSPVWRQFNAVEFNLAVIVGCTIVKEGHCGFRVFPARCCEPTRLRCIFTTVHGVTTLA